MKNILNYLGLFFFLFGLNTTLNAQNHSLYFDGLDSKIGVLDSPDLNPGNAMTVEAWINAEEWAGPVWGGSIFSKQGSNPDQGYTLTAGANGQVQFTISVDGAWVEVTSSSSLINNVWYHIAGVYTGSELRLYINGELAATGSAIGSHTTSDGVVVNIGENPTWGGRYWHGQLDEIRVWNLARTQQEIQDNMTTDLTGNESGLAAYYPFNEGTGNSLGDMSQNTNDGQLLNMQESDWMNGYEIIPIDLSVTGIAAPSVIGSGFTATEEIKIEITNTSNTPINDYELSYSINGGSPISENVNVLIEPFQSYIHTFSNTEDLSGMTSVEIEGSLSLSGDGDASNNTLSESIEQSLTFTLFDNVTHNFGTGGQTHFNSLFMPGDLGNFSHIYLNIDLECPVGGCDPWDQAGKMSLIKDGEKYELVRYVTPYGKACGGWTWDISDFRSLMTNFVSWESFIQVWGSSGWDLIASLEFVEGIPSYDEVTVHKLWSEDYWTYGEPTVSYDFPERNIALNSNTEAVKIRMNMSGHGQGNTNNAAEFSNFTHYIHLDGTEAFEQELWKNDCATNDCSGQFGNWMPSRAGWCPGQDIQPWEWDLSENQYTPGINLAVDFVLYDYTNFLNTGYNNGSHTEPYYRCHAYLIEYAGANQVGLDEIENSLNLVQVFPNPSKAVFNFNSVNKDALVSIEVREMNGKLIFSENNISSSNFELDLSNEAAGIYLGTITTQSGTQTVKLILE